MCIRDRLTVLAAYRLSDPNNARTSVASLSALQSEDQRFASLRYVREQPSELSSVALSPDGRTIVSGSDDNTVRLWSVLESWADALCAKLPRNMSRKEWREWVGTELSYTCQCPGLPVPPDDDPLSTTQAEICPTPYQPQPVVSRGSQ